MIPIFKEIVQILNRILSSHSVQISNVQQTNGKHQTNLHTMCTSRSLNSHSGPSSMDWWGTRGMMGSHCHNMYLVYRVGGIKWWQHKSSQYGTEDRLSTFWNFVEKTSQIVPSEKSDLSPKCFELELERYQFVNDFFRFEIGIPLDTSNPVPVKDPTTGEQPKKKTPYETVENSQIRLNQAKYMKSQ